MMNVGGILGYKYYYDDFNEHTGRATFAQDISQFDSSPTGQGPRIKAYGVPSRPTKVELT